MKDSHFFGGGVLGGVGVKPIKLIKTHLWDDQGRKKASHIVK